MSTTSRDEILHRIRTEVSKGAEVAEPPVPEVWPRGSGAGILPTGGTGILPVESSDTGETPVPPGETPVPLTTGETPVPPGETPVTPAALADRFESELKAVHGEVIRCGTLEQAGKQLAELIKQAGWTTIGVMYRQICCDAVKELDAKIIQWPKPNWPPVEMADLSASIVAADVLLADTGSSLIACPTAEDRLLCYLPPACVILARIDQLAEHLPAAWETVARRCASRELSGEFVIVTGPSRTSDIEKTLILGVHGPKRLVVMLVG